MGFDFAISERRLIKVKVKPNHVLFRSNRIDTEFSIIAPALYSATGRNSVERHLNKSTELGYTNIMQLH